MTILNTAKFILRRFARADRGNVAIIFAVSIVPLLAAAGAAIDLMRMSAAQTQLQAALDAGSLAGAMATKFSSTQRINIATAAFNDDLKNSDFAGMTITPAFTINTSTVVGTVSASLPTSLMNVVGITAMDVSAKTEVSSPGPSYAEIAFVLDYSGSMADTAGSQVKYIAMRDAATKLINDLTAANPNKLKFALVPFSDQVYTSLPQPDVLGQTGLGTWTGCTLDNPYPFNLTDALPNGTNASKWGQAFPPNVYKTPCSGYVQRNLKIRPLSNDYAGLKSQIAAMTPYANTHIALGVQFGYQVLSPNGVYNSVSQIASYSDKTNTKYLVLLTDGTQTEPAFGKNGARDVTSGETNLVAVCNNAKSVGITILTMAVGVDDAATSSRLQNCSSDPGNDFFVINTSDDMATAFQSITGKINSMAFLSK